MVWSKRSSPIIETLRREGAIRPTAAMPLPGLGEAEQRQLERLLRRGVVQEVEPGMFYVLEAIWTADREIRRLSLMIALLVLWVGFLLALLFGFG
jgi:hypothetical protein